MGGYERHPRAVVARRGRRRRDPGRLQRPPARGGLGALRGDHRQRPQARAGDGRGHDHAADQRAGGVHARRRVLPRRDRRCAASSSPPASAPTGSRARAAMGKRDGGVDRRGRAVARPVGDGHRGASASTTARPPTRSSARARSTRPTTTSSTPATSARRGGRCASPRSTTGTPAHGAAFGEKSGWERVNWYEANAAAGDEALRPRGWAGQHWSPAIGAEHAAMPRGRRAVRRDLVREAGDQRPGRRRAARAAVRQPRRPRAGQGHLHADAQPPRRDRVRLHGHAARGGPLLDRHRHRVRHPRPRLDQLARRATDVLVRGRHLALGLPRAVGPAGARRPRPAARPTRSTSST